MTYCTVHLYGSLAYRYGESFNAEVEDLTDVFDLLSANYSDFLPWFYKEAHNGSAYQIAFGDEFLTEDTIFNEITVEDVYITPVVGSSGGGFGSILQGVAIIGLGVVTGGFGLIPTSTFILMGSTMILRGVMELISPKEETATNEADGSKSSLFNSGVTTTKAGNIYPLCFGWPIAKSQVLVFGIETEPIDPDPDDNNEE